MKPPTNERRSLHEAVRRARTAFENKSIDPELLSRLYGEYSEICDPQSFVRRAFDLFPFLNCGLASVYLKFFLKGGEVVQGSYDGFLHTFLRHRGFIVDITADQFGGPRIYVGQVRCGRIQKPWSFRSAWRGIEPRASLCANVDETDSDPKFSVEGGG